MDIDLSSNVTVVIPACLLPVDDPRLSLSTGTTNVLKRFPFTSVLGGVMMRTKMELNKTPGLGKVSVAAIEEIAAALGHELGTRLPDPSIEAMRAQPWWEERYEMYLPRKR